MNWSEEELLYKYITTTDTDAQTHKDLPTQFLFSKAPVSASIVIGSFGSTSGYESEAFALSVEIDPNVPVAAGEKPERYGKLPEIRHVFRGDPKSPNVLISMIFGIAVFATLPVLLGSVCCFQPHDKCNTDLSF